MPTTPTLRAGIDIGGTFTDLILLDPATGAYTIAKTLTTPEDPSQAIETALTELGNHTHIADLIHGTTLVTNALIERKGDLTALLTTEGFRDAIEIRRENRYDLYDLSLDLPQPLVPRYLRFGIPERTLADGSIHAPLNTEAVESLTRELAENQIVAIAVTFLNSFANPTHERLAREAIHRVAPHIRVSLSSEVSPTIREFERTSTTIANVFVQARVERYLTTLLARLDRLHIHATFRLMLSSGAIATPATAIAFPIRLLESGPAAGALAAATYGLAANHPNLVSFDMGGTTAKFCVIANGAPTLAHHFEFDRIYRFRQGSGLPATIPAIEMVEIGAGGGSIARINPLGLLKVGPHSAAAHPGPVCYNRGGTLPTVTDADLILGYLDPQFFLGGKMPLALEAARASIDTHIATPLNLSIEQAAWGIHHVVNETMASAARTHLLERGQDPSVLPMFAFGGAGPVHAHRIAHALGSPRLIVPLGAGVISTIGFLTAPTAFDFVRPFRTPLAHIDWPHAHSLLTEMEAEGRTLLRESGIPEAEIQTTRTVDMRYQGQGHEIPVPLTEDLQTAFEAAYQSLYNRPGPPVPLEIINWRVTVSGPKPQVRLHITPATNTPIQKGTRPAFFPEANAFLDTPVLNRYAMPPGHTFTGPAIVEERESTTIVAPNAHCHIDPHFNLVIE